MALINPAVIDSTPLNVFAYRLVAPGLDPILVVYQNLGQKAGRVIIECFGQAWSCYWAAMGTDSVCDFIKRCDTEYLVDRLWNAKIKRTRIETAYLTRIVEAVRASLLQLPNA